MGADVLPAADAAPNNQSDSFGGLTVRVGGPFSTAALPAQGLLLIVEADQERALQLTEALEGRRDVLVCAEVLTAQAGTPVPWFRFNDPRLNGPWPESHWRPLYPNLRQQGEEQRGGRRLDEVLESWGGLEELQPQMALQLHQGDPLAALEGLGAWLTRLQVVQWPRLLGPTGSAAAVAAWLADRGFRADDDDEAVTTWRRDPVASQRLVVLEREQQIAALQEQLSNLTVQLQLTQARHEELSAAHDQLLVGFEGLRTQCDAITAERDQLRADCDACRDRAESLQRRLDQINTDVDEMLLLIDQVDTP